jgi:hypothetical protein
MTITTTKLTRAAGLCAVAGGLLFIAVQINHPQVDATFATTTEYTVRETIKIGMAILSLIGLTGIYLSQVKRMGGLGLVGYVLFGACYLILMSVQIIGVCILPSLVASNPAFVNDVLSLATGGHPTGELGLFRTLNVLSTVSYLGGGLIFGVAIFRAGVLARWAAVCLAAGTLAVFAIPLLPQVNQRLFAIPTGIALIGLGYSLWREQRTLIARPVTSSAGSPLDPAGAK